MLNVYCNRNLWQKSCKSVSIVTWAPKFYWRSIWTNRTITRFLGTSTLSGHSAMKLICMSTTDGKFSTRIYSTFPLPFLSFSLSSPFLITPFQSDFFSFMVVFITYNNIRNLRCVRAICIMSSSSKLDSDFLINKRGLQFYILYFFSGFPFFALILYFEVCYLFWVFSCRVVSFRNRIFFWHWEKLSSVSVTYFDVSGWVNLGAFLFSVSLI